MQFTAETLVAGIAHGSVASAVDELSILAECLQTVLRERIHHIFIRIIVEGSRIVVAQSVTGGVAGSGAEHDIGHRVGCPFDACLPIPTVGAGITLVEAVGEGSRLADEVLTGVLRVDVAVAVVPSDAAVYFDDVFLFIVDIHATHLRGVEAIAVSAKAATSAKSHVVDIVGVAHSKDTGRLVKPSAEESFGIPVLGTHTEIDVGHGSLAHASLGTEVEHRLLVTVVDAGDTCQVALLIVGFHLVDDACRDILHGRLGVTGHKLFTVEHDLFHLLAVDGDLTVVAHLSAGQSLDEFLDGGAFGGTVSSAVIYKGVLLECHLQCLSRHLCLFEHHGIGVDNDVAQSQVVLSLHLQTLDGRDIADAGDFQQVFSGSWCLNDELTAVVTHGAGDKGRVGLEQLNGDHRHGLFGVAVNERTLDFLLRCR